MPNRTAVSITPALTELFNLSITSGSIPQKWKLSSAVPIPKSSANAEYPSNRPISVYECLAERELLSAVQWGFCPGKSALVPTFHNIL